MEGVQNGIICALLKWSILQKCAANNCFLSYEQT